MAETVNPNKTVGVIGLGTMGSNLANNLCRNKYKVYVYNRTTSKTEDLVRECPEITGCKTVEELISQLHRPRKIILMLTAGHVVDNFLGDLKKLVDKDDAVIDFGNSYYKDTIRRYQQFKNDFNFVGCGISGGEYGALNGPSLMVGCKKEVYEEIGGMLNDVSVKYCGVPCCGWLGDDGAGHFVKAVHNGIEYCEMQLLQEVLNIVSADVKRIVNDGNGNVKADVKAAVNDDLNDNVRGNLNDGNVNNKEFDNVMNNNTELAFERVKSILSDWNKGKLGGYLVEICIKILNKKINGRSALDEIEDKAEQKGTGKMCIISSAEADCDTTAMAESVMARFLSNKKNKRIGFAAMLLNENKQKNNSLDKNDLKGAFYLCKAVSYIQGCNLLESFKKSHCWEYTIPQICDVWRDGCILRCEFLDELKAMGEEECLETSKVFKNIYEENINSLKKVCIYATENDIYAPVFTSCLMWLNGLKMDKNNGNFIQAMRDYFGRHGVVLKSGETVNIEWDE